MRDAIKAHAEAEAEAMTPEEREKHRFTGSLLPTTAPVFADLIANERLLEAFEGLGFSGSHCGNTKWSCGFIISKPPRSPSLAWHQDCAVWDHDIAYQKVPHQVTPCHADTLSFVNRRHPLCPRVGRTRRRRQCARRLACFLVNIQPSSHLHVIKVCE